MSYTVFTKHADGSMSRKRVITSDHERALQRVHNEKMKSLRDKNGWSHDKKHKLKASIPADIVEEVMINDGPEAARDLDHLIRVAESRGIKVRPGR